MNDVQIIWERYQKLNEANLISTDPLHLELEKILKEKNVQNPQIKDWLLKTYIKWFKSPADDNQKTTFITPYQAKDTDPDWAKKEGIFQFNQFTPEYKERLLHIIDFLITKDEFYFKSLFKVTVPQMFQEVEKWDQEMERSAEKSKKAKLQSVQGTDYEVVGVYDGYPVWKLISNKSFREESMYMGHCVGQAARETKVTSVEGDESQYFKAYKEHELLIFSLRDPKEHNHPAVTFELRKEYGDYEFKIYQIKGPANRSVSERYRKACKEFIEDKEYIVKRDGENLEMVKWDNKFYFKDNKEFNHIYNSEILPFQKQNISSVMNSIKNNEINVSVDLTNLFLTELPDFTNIKCKYSFNCSGNQLTTLEGAPQSVGGDFYCSENQLTTLEGAPQKVDGSFLCSKNQLTTLKGAPQSVGINFDCSRNQLTTLEGVPQSVSINFDCSRNQLTTLKGAPQSVDGDFSCPFNQLTTLEGAPQSVGGDFSCDVNQLTTLEGAPQSVDGSFYCDNNPTRFTELDKRQAMVNSFNRNRKETKLESFKEFYTEACWKNYKQVGTKKKGKKEVPNCVPK